MSSIGDDATTLHVGRARRGDLESLGWLVERLSPLLLAQARWRLGPRLARYVDPEDLVQEAWAVALPRLGSLEAPAGRATPALVRFLSTTVLQLVNNGMRKQARRSPGPEVDPAWSALAAETRGVVTRLTRGEAAEALSAAVESLEEDERALVVMRGIEQLDNATVAEHLGISPNAASLRYGRALARLRERFPGSALEDLADAADF